MFATLQAQVSISHLLQAEKESPDSVLILEADPINRLASLDAISQRARGARVDISNGFVTLILLTLYTMDWAYSV